jgi:hypothetical protein
VAAQREKPTMPFASFSSIAEVARAYEITLRQEEFVVPLPLAVPGTLRSDLDFAQNHVAFRVSEYAVCENLIYPILREVWKSYRDQLMLWSHIPLTVDQDLSGTPDYLVARMSHLGMLVMEEPFMIVVEAKKDDFDRGWTQCLAAMLAARKLNKMPAQTLYGICTNGRGWEFARLEGETLIQDPRPFSLYPLEDLFAALNFVFAQCRQELLGRPRAA